MRLTARVEVRLTARVRDEAYSPGVRDEAYSQSGDEAYSQSER